MKRINIGPLFLLLLISIRLNGIEETSILIQEVIDQEKDVNEPIIISKLISLHYPEWEKIPPLLCCCLLEKFNKEFCYNAAKILIERGAALLYETSSVRRSVFHALAFFNRNSMDENDSESLLNIFIKKRDFWNLLDYQDEQGNTPLHIAMKSHYSKFALFLIKNGANVNMINSARQTPIFYMQKLLEHDRRPKILSAFCQANVNLNLQDIYGNTPLHIAMAFDEPDFVDFLINKGAHINIKNKKGNTPLFFIKEITKELRLEVLSAFLKAGVDLSVKNISQESLLEIFNKKSLSKEKEMIEQENLKRVNCWDSMQQLHKNKSSLISELPKWLLPAVGSYIFHQELPVAIDEAPIPLSSVKVKLLEMKLA